MMPLFDIAYLVQQQNRQAAATHEAPIPPSAPRRSNTRSMDDQQSNDARQQYYQLHREPIQRPCPELRDAGSDIDTKVHLYDEVAPNEDDNTVRDNHDSTLYCKNQYSAEQAEFDDYIERPSPIIDHKAERAAARDCINVTTAALPTAVSAVLIFSLPNFALAFILVLSYQDSLAICGSGGRKVPQVTTDIPSISTLLLNVTGSEIEEDSSMAL
ncbi:hypothetical protein V8C40DRAFT_264756 [Trichoderma camerunense]